MLDECKGERLEEVLLAFSTAVLKKVVATEKKCKPSVAKQLSLTPNISMGDQKSLLPLAIAHRASLTSLLDRKARLRARYRAFHHLLDGKEQQILKIAGSLALENRSSDSKVDYKNSISKIRDQFDVHWRGDPRWKEVIFDGQNHAAHDPILDIPFSEFISSNPDDFAGNLSVATEQSLLSSLNERVKAQEVRLEKWRTFRDTLATGNASGTYSSESISTLRQEDGSGQDNRGQADLTLNQPDVKRTSPKRTLSRRGSVPQLVDEYEKLTRTMQKMLVQENQPNNHSANCEQVPPNARLLERSKKEVQAKAKILDSSTGNQRHDSPEKPRKADLDFVKSDESIEPSNPELSTETSNERFTGKTTCIVYALEISLTKLEALSRQDQPANSTLSQNDMNPAKKSEICKGGEEQLTSKERMISGTNATPSLVKLRPSLLERTRKSMALATADTIAPNTDFILPPSVRGPNSSTPPHRKPNGRETLQERTRQSMSSLPSKLRPSRNSVHKPPSKIYPTNQFETPRKLHIGGPEYSTPSDELFSQDANYASVFKSRPKIALSPTLTPIGQPTESHGLVNKLDDQWDSSPLTRTAIRLS